MMEDDDVELYNIRGRVKLLRRYEALKMEDKKIINKMKICRIKGC